MHILNSGVIDILRLSSLSPSTDPITITGTATLPNNCDRLFQYKDFSEIHIDISTSNVTSMVEMFKGATASVIDLGTKFDTSNVNTSHMFTGTLATKIYYHKAGPEFTSWNDGLPANLQAFTAQGGQRYYAPSQDAQLDAGPIITIKNFVILKDGNNIIKKEITDKTYVIVKEGNNIVKKKVKGNSVILKDGNNIIKKKL